jgi:hypothetical protein
VANYVIGNHGPTRGHLDYLNDLYQTHELPEGLMASMKAVGLAGYAHAAQAPSLMQNARYQYMRALQFTNASLRSPKEFKKDTTLMAVMILGIFETVTGCNQGSITAWAEHGTYYSMLILNLGTYSYDALFVHASKPILFSVAGSSVANFHIV